MFKIRLILGTRNILPNSSFLTRSKSNTSSSSSSSSSDDENTKKAEQKDKAEEALKKLNTLLSEIVQETTTAKKLDLAKPSNKRKTKEQREAEKEAKTTTDTDKSLVEAVKTVAKSIGGDIQQTESELLQKLLSPVETKEGEIKNLTDIVKGLKIDRESKPVEETRNEQVRKMLQRSRQTQRSDSGEDHHIKRVHRPVAVPGKRIAYELINLFDSERLGIFNVEEQSKNSDGPQLKTYQKLKEKELKLAVTHPPANYFQQMILWTEQGKVWKFPIDNEQGMEKEQSIYFTEHIFLEKYLEPWCPPKGPLRHFMELVCVGLSKNPYLTVEDKREHIDWYRKYFEDKKALLEEVGALQGHDLSATKAIEG